MDHNETKIEKKKKEKEKRKEKKVTSIFVSSGSKIPINCWLNDILSEIKEKKISENSVAKSSSEIKRGLTWRKI